ncbi:CHAT domain-containing protein [Candidatus Halobeggiatoa sp. HSG11]|nr:CHAT domain-containing protein [Candidatus Halobeggiatoa sp. HSG11]
MTNLNNVKNLKDIGLSLWQGLNTIPTTIKYNATDNVPWECLYHPELGFIAKHTDYTLYRRIYAAKSSIPTGPLKILLFTIQQTTQRQIHLDIDIEAQQIRSALKNFINAGWVKFYAPVDGYLSTLTQLLKNQDWHLVIISGHGLLKNNQTYLVFTDVNGNKKLITGYDLAKIFKKARCVVLATCKSGQLVKHNLIEPLVQIGIPNIIGMRESLIDRAARIFIQTLCINLAQQKNVDEAVQISRCAMTDLLSPDEIWHKADQSVFIQWSLPILFSSDPVLINWNFKPHKSYSIPKTKIFIGRQQELQVLIKKLQIEKRLLIVGTGGIGKTALAEQLAINLLQDGYHVLTNDVENLEQNYRVILTSRYKIPTLSYFYTYQLNKPYFHDFSRYVHYLNLPYEFPQILRIYQMLGGNFRAVQLLQNLPVYLDKTSLDKQLKIIQRYLQAELRK